MRLLNETQWMDLIYPKLASVERTADTAAYSKLSRVIGYLRRERSAAPKGGRYGYLMAEIVVVAVRTRFENPNPYKGSEGRGYSANWDRWVDGVNGSFNSDED